MATVNEEIVADVIANDGWYPGDPMRVVKCVRYDNAFGGKSWAIVYEGENKNRYEESEFCQNVVTLWEAKK
jgi:hypothetical protein